MLRFHRRTMFRVFAAVCLAATAVTSAATAHAQDQKQQVIDLINQERVKRGMVALAKNDKLMTCAQDWSQYMADNNYYFHQSPDGTTPQQRAQRAGYTGFSGFENIFKGPSTAQEAYSGWVASDGHNANMFKPELNEVGIGIATDAAGLKYWTYLGGVGENVTPPAAGGIAAAKPSWEDKHTQFSGGPILVSVSDFASATGSDPQRPGFKTSVLTGVLKAGRKYTIEVKSNTFSTYLRLDNVNNPADTLTSQSSPNSILVTRPTADATYRLYASSQTQGASGMIEVSITSMPAN